MIGRTALVGGMVCSLVASASLAQSVEKMLFVTNRESATVSCLRVNYDGTLSMVMTYNVGAFPQDCAVSPDGRFLVVVNSDPGASAPESLKVLRINPNGTVSGPVASTLIGDAPMAVGMSRNGFALAPSTFDDAIESLAIDEFSVTPVNAAPAGAFPFRPVSTLDSKFVYCAGSISPDDIVTFGLSDSGALSRLSAIDIPGAASFGIALHPAGNRLYVSTGQANAIRWYSVNTTTGALTFGGSMNPGGNSVTELAVTPDGKWLISAHVLSDTVNVSRINADGSITATGFSSFITSDVRDVVTDGTFVYATDESLLGGTYGIYAFAINPVVGALTQIAPPFDSGGFTPQFMALWVPPVCTGDADGNGVVEFRDITTVLTHWGGGGPSGDANHDRTVDFADISAVLSGWGECVSP